MAAIGVQGPTVIRSRSCSTVRAEMPRTRARSSICLNGPCAVRSSMMRCAIAGPMAGSASSSSFVAVLILTRVAAVVARAGVAFVVGTVVAVAIVGVVVLAGIGVLVDAGVVAVARGTVVAV